MLILSKHYFAENALVLRQNGQVDSRDKMTFTSPLNTFSSKTTISFKTMMSTAEYDVLPKLKVFLKDTSSIEKEPLLVIEKTWRYVCIRVE